MTAGIRKGINKVSWNLRSTPPKVAAGSAKMDGAGFTAPMVLPGLYTVKLKLNDKEYTSTINCIHDKENADLTESDRKLVYDQATKLKALFENVNRLIDSVSYYKLTLKTDSIDFNKNKTKKYFIQI